MSLVDFAWRSETVSTTGSFKWFSRETALLLNNVVLVTAAIAVFVGTLYPLVVDAFGLGKISVGRPYFDSMFALIGHAVGGYQGGIFFDLTGNYTQSYVNGALAGLVNLVIVGSLFFTVSRRRAALAGAS